tara:strand:+ start:424 stop:705 length:282 start_codon:yes stop_codon:yes gene_type:complete
MVLLLATSAVWAQDAPEAPEEQQEDIEPSDTADSCEEKTKDLKNDMMGLEFFLQDKSDYKTYCPYEDWTQPSILVYKEKPKSYLPESCKAEKI